MNKILKSNSFISKNYTVKIYKIKGEIIYWYNGKYLDGFDQSEIRNELNNYELSYLERSSWNDNSQTLKNYLLMDIKKQTTRQNDDNESFFSKCDCKLCIKKKLPNHLVDLEIENIKTRSDISQLLRFILYCLTHQQKELEKEYQKISKLQLKHTFVSIKAIQAYLITHPILLKNNGTNQSLDKQKITSCLFNEKYFFSSGKDVLGTTGFWELKNFENDPYSIDYLRKEKNFKQCQKKLFSKGEECEDYEEYDNDGFENNQLHDKEKEDQEDDQELVEEKQCDNNTGLLKRQYDGVESNNKKLKYYEDKNNSIKTITNIDLPPIQKQNVRQLKNPKGYEEKVFQTYNFGSVYKFFKFQTGIIDDDFVLEICKEYIRFILLKIIVSDTCSEENDYETKIAPPPLIEKFWHSHLSHTDEYSLFCSRYAGAFLGCDPQINCEPIEIQKTRFETTLSLYCLYFTKDLNLKIWEYDSKIEGMKNKLSDNYD